MVILQRTRPFALSSVFLRLCLGSRRGRMRLLSLRSRMGRIGETPKAKLLSRRRGRRGLATRHRFPLTYQIQTMSLRTAKMMSLRRFTTSAVSHLCPMGIDTI
jgi:hypothetical protein